MNLRPGLACRSARAAPGRGIIKGSGRVMANQETETPEKMKRRRGRQPLSAYSPKSLPTADYREFEGMALSPDWCARTIQLEFARRGKSMRTAGVEKEISRIRKRHNATRRGRAFDAAAPVPSNVARQQVGESITLSITCSSEGVASRTAAAIGSALRPDGGE